MDSSERNLFALLLPLVLFLIFFSDVFPFRKVTAILDMVTW